jgi:hypothetical protein
MNEQQSNNTIETPNPIVDKPQTVFSDSETVAILRDFLAADKPADATPLDILQTVYLLVRKAGDHDIYDSQQTLASRLGVDLTTVNRSQKRLASPLDWIARHQRRGRSSTLSVNVDKLPRHKKEPLVISQDARALAAFYRGLLEQKTGKTRWHKHWYTQQLPSAQNIINRCEGKPRRVSALELAKFCLEVAFDDPVLNHRAGKSLYELFRIWDKVFAAFDKMVEQGRAHKEAARAAQANEQKNGGNEQ